MCPYPEELFRVFVICISTVIINIAVTGVILELYRKEK